MPRHRKPVCLSASAVLIAVACIAFPLPATGADGPQTDLRLILEGVTRGAGTDRTLRFVVNNDGPAAVQNDDAQIEITWTGGVGLRPGDACRLVTEKTCLLDAGFIDAFDPPGPVAGLAFRRFEVGFVFRRLTIVAVRLVQSNYVDTGVPADTTQSMAIT